MSIALEFYFCHLLCKFRNRYYLKVRRIRFFMHQWKQCSSWTTSFKKNQHQWFFFIFRRQILIKIVDIHCVQSIDVTIHIEYILQNEFNINEINIQVNEKKFERKFFFRSSLFLEINFDASSRQFDFDSSDFLINNILRLKFDIYSKLLDDSFDVFFKNFITRFAHSLIIRTFEFLFTLTLHTLTTSKKHKTTFIVCST